MMDEFGLNDERRRRLRYLLEVPNLVLDGVRRQIALGVYKSREEADAGLRFTLDDAAQEIESMLTPEQFARLKPIMEQAPARSYMLGVSSVLKVAGKGLNDDEYVRMVNLVAREFAKEKIHPAIHWVAVFAERNEVEVYLEKRKQVVRAVVEQATTFITDAQIASLMKHEQVQLDHAFTVWEDFRFKFPDTRLKIAP